ncbi:hypothetical protein DAPPUDRAFT_116136 [Daphnia pulex]|uniref:Uncharacterized protein n=1 Tax=Daphnia pulex TaxID=6669 RepID=E9HNP2_DAPPU|nr:hypothetical protein DAPPUDRAFT_116136 [Daphnia pulex]|eukprot:EFX66644.1 hypothetical protein DAPPUDRAFT_116136 [Daphnia pulex]
MAEDTAVEVPHKEEDATQAEKTSNNEEPAAQAEDTSNNEEPDPTEEIADQPTAEIPTTKRKSSRTPVFSGKFLEWKRSLSKNKENKSKSFGMEVTSTILTEKPEPRTYKEAMESEDAEKWKTTLVVGLAAEIVSRILLGKEKMALEVVDCTTSQLGNGVVWIWRGRDKLF